MLLGDLGADVIRIDRPAGADLYGFAQVNGRNRRSLGLDLKHPDGVEVCLDLIATADVLLEGMRPGVAERLGIGPDECHRRNQGLIYGRMTGWGQEGPQRARAGHDIDYIAVSGALGAIGAGGGGKPIVPLNLVGDFGGGALFLVMGVLAALVERSASGHGQVIDAAMVDGAASLMTMFYEMRALGLWEGSRGGNLIDGGAPFYDTYQTADGRWMAVGALESKFFAVLLEVLEVTDFDVADQYERGGWPRLRGAIADAFRSRSRDDWEDRFRDTDACAWPVLDIEEAPRHPINVSRSVFIDVAGVTQPGPAPRFSRTAADPPNAPLPTGASTDAILGELGYDQDRIRLLHQSGAVFSTM
jgi:alpha-methylacyl-CoA racemase